MVLHRVVRKIAPTLALALGSVITLQSAAFAEEYRGTMEQQMACTPDVFRFCGSQIPDVNRIVGCLRQNTAQLSGPCRAVFDSNASMPQPSQQAAPGRHETPAGDDGE